MMNRRKFLKSTALFTLGLKLNGSFVTNSELIKRHIPGTNELLPTVGLGTWIQFDVSSTSSELSQLTSVLKAMHEKGGKLIDSSPMYGKAESRVGDLTQKLDANQFFYATKVWTTGKENGIQQMTSSMQKMQREQLDLMQIHNLLDWKIHLNTLKAWKEQGKIRYIGITHYTNSSHDELAQIIKTEQAIDFVQFNYSITNRHAESRLLETARDKNVAVIINRPYQGGSLFRLSKDKPLPSLAKEFGIESWGQYFLKFIISHPAVTCVIPGTSKPKHMIDNMHAAYGKLPDAEQREAMYQYFSKL